MSNQDTLAALRAALAKATDPGELAKATFQVASQMTSATTGLQAYDLEAPAKNLYPVLTPLRNRIPRVSAVGSIQANWKGVTALDPGQNFPGVSEGHRGGLINYSMKEYFAAYRTLGSEAAVTYEAELAANGFDDLRARATQMNLQALMINEEKTILGGNTSYGLGTTPTPVLTTSTTGGTIGSTVTVSVICIALTYDGYNRANASTGIVSTVSRTTADGYSESFNAGTAAKSNAQTIATGAGSTNSVTATVSTSSSAYTGYGVPGAFGYLWYWGAAGSETCGALTRVPQVVITKAAGGGQAIASAAAGSDASTNSLVFDGLLAMAWGVNNSATNGGYITHATPGSGLTGDGTGGIVEFDTALQWFWDNLRLTPSRILVSSQEMIYIRKKILAGNSSTSGTRFVFNVAQNQITGGGLPKGYLNPFVAGAGPAELPLELHPYMPPGTVLFLTDEIPYPMNNINNMMQIRTRRDYYSIEWPQKTRMYEYGVYVDAVLQHYFMPSMGIITGLSAA